MAKPLDQILELEDHWSKPPSPPKSGEVVVPSCTIVCGPVSLHLEHRGRHMPVSRCPRHRRPPCATSSHPFRDRLPRLDHLCPFVFINSKPFIMISMAPSEWTSWTGVHGLGLCSMSLFHRFSLRKTILNS
jgi:hypothetical protein